MVVCGGIMFAIIGLSFIQLCRKKLGATPWLLRACLWSIPLPFIACEAGWFVAEYGRQPWAIAEVLPVNMAVSNLAPSDIWISLGVIFFLYSAFLIIEIYLMVRFAKIGPSVLKTGRYHFENAHSSSNTFKPLS